MKTKTMILGMALGGALISQLASAGTETHGGQVVVCKTPDGTVKSMEMLDHYEGKIISTSGLDMGAETDSYTQQVATVLNRLAKLDPIAAARYQQRAKDFVSNMRLLTPDLMKRIADSNEPINTAIGCEKVQFAVQIFPAKQYEKLYLVDQALWASANERTKAGLVLHEIIYTDALSEGETNSDHTRYYNFMISSQQMNSFSPGDYRSFVQNVGFVDSSCDFSVINYGAKGVVSCISAYQLLSSTAVLKDGQNVPVTLSGEACADGSAHDTQNYCSVVVKQDFNMTLPSMKILVSAGSSLKIYKTGYPNSGVLSEDTIVNDGKYQTTLTKGTAVNLNPDGSFASVQINGFAGALFVIDGQPIDLSLNSLNLDSSRRAYAQCCETQYDFLQLRRCSSVCSARYSNVTNSG